MKLSPRLFALALALTGSAGLGGCGFTPLYAISGVTPKLAQIEVSRPDGRAGFLLGQSLDDEFGRNGALPPLYRLTLKLNEVRIPRGITVDNVATRYEVDMSVNYVLSDIKTHAQVTRGVATVNATYDDPSQPYAGIAAELDGERRASEAAAQRIRLELATYFASPRPDTPGVDAQSAAIGATGASTVYADGIGVSPVQSPRERAAGAGTPAAADVPDPYGSSPP